MGEDAYWTHLLDLLSRASPRDCAAAGLGCTRRTDRACGAPGICALDPVAPARGEGPVAGACGGFHGEARLRVEFSADDRHRAVFLRDERTGVARLWVDGEPVAEGGALDAWGYWLGDRHLVVRAEGPPGHPRQQWFPGSVTGSIASLLIHDVLRQRSRVLVPTDTENWTEPQVALESDELRVYPDSSARTADAPDRVLDVEESVDAPEPGCMACGLVAGTVPLPGGVVLRTAHWIAEHCVGPLGAGTLVVKPLRHVLHMADLTAPESAELGPLLRRLSTAVTEVTRPEQVYVCQWSHAGAVPDHIHFVVQPARREDMDRYDAYGPGLQMAMFRADRYPDETEVNAVCDALRAALAAGVRVPGSRVTGGTVGG